MDARAGPELAPPAAELDPRPREQLGHSFKATMAAVRRLRGRETQHLGELSHAQYSLLFGLAAEPELSAASWRAIADLSPATVTQMLDHLEADGLVTRVRSSATSASSWCP